MCNYFIREVKFNGISFISCIRTTRLAKRKINERTHIERKTRRKKTRENKGEGKKLAARLYEIMMERAWNREKTTEGREY